VSDGLRFRTVCTGCHKPLGWEFHPQCPDCGALSDVEYDLPAVELRDSVNPYRRFADLLPIGERTLLPDDASFTPTVHATSLGEALGMSWLYLKD
jgi:hypothetical protein